MKCSLFSAVILWLPYVLIAQDPAPEPGRVIQQQRVFKSLAKTFQHASAPSKLFYAPSARVLRSMEVSLSGGNSYGVEESGGLLTRFGLGLGNVAELEFSTTQVANELTGTEIRFPSRILKVNLMPVRWRSHPWIPSITCQLRTSSWGEVMNRGSRINAAVTAEYNQSYHDFILNSLVLQSRFTTFYIVAGKDGRVGGIHLGLTLTDVRTKEGGQWTYNLNTYAYEYIRIPEMQKNLLQPFGGLLLNANDNTQILAELASVPAFRYNIKEKRINITHAWAGIGGVRFFMAAWLSCDAGVRYLSTFKGIADAEISMAVNLILPLKSYTE
jgi:hypothetical protein